MNPGHKKDEREQKQRMGTFDETEEGDKINLGVFKSITGGDPIEARGLFKDPIEIFKTWHGGMSFHGGIIGRCRSNQQMDDLPCLPIDLRIRHSVTGTGMPWK